MRRDHLAGLLAGYHRHDFQPPAQNERDAADALQVTSNLIRAQWESAGITGTAALHATLPWMPDQVRRASGKHAPFGSGKMSKSRPGSAGGRASE